MSISYGRLLPKGPRPKPPQPKLGNLGPVVKRKKRKKKQNNSPQRPYIDSQQQTGRAQGQTPKAKKKRKKAERPRQNQPVKVEIVNLDSATSPKVDARSNRVVVEWRRTGYRYLAWGRRGVKAVDGWRECSAEDTYQNLLRRLHPIGIKLNVTDSKIPTVEILDLMIAAGRIIKPRQKLTLVALVLEPSMPPAQMKRSSRSGSPGNQVKAQRRSAAAEVARNEILVIRPIDGKPSGAARARAQSNQNTKNERKRRQMLDQHRREFRRLNWLRKNGYQEQDAPDDMMHRALQGGAPGLRR